MKATTFAALALCLLASATAAAPVLDGPGTHLEPESRVWDIDRFWDDTRVVRAVFHEAFDDDVILRMHFSATMGSRWEGIIALKEKPARIVIVQTDVGLFHYTERGREPADTAIPADYRKIRPMRCEVAVPSQLGGRIAGAWRRVLLQTRYDERPWQGMDGQNYWFWQRVDDLHVLSGRIWSPDPGTKPYMLIGIALAMQNYCAARDANHLGRLSSLVGELEYHLQAEANP